MKYYILEKTKIAEYTPAMEQSFGHNNISIRMSLDDTKGLMQFTDELAPGGITGYDSEIVKEILKTSEWTEESDYVPEKVSASQIRQALILSDIKLSDIITAIEAVPDATLREILTVRWEYETNYYRNNTEINQIAGALGLTQPQLDEIFKTAITL